MYSAFTQGRGRAHRGYGRGAWVHGIVETAPVPTMAADANSEWVFLSPQARLFSTPSSAYQTPRTSFPPGDDDAAPLQHLPQHLNTSETGRVLAALDRRAAPQSSRCVRTARPDRSCAVREPPSPSSPAACVNLLLGSPASATPCGAAAF